jgi:tetratricopeptide (TPR) repeat protein
MTKIFLSCVSAEFAEFRNPLSRDLRGPNVEVKAHEEVCEHNSGLTTLEKLEEYISTCSAIVHLVGSRTGSSVEVSQVDAIKRRHPDLAQQLPQLAPLLAGDADWRGSYTQWEAYLAIYHQLSGRLKGCWVYIAAEGASAAESDLGLELERKRQSEHFERLKELGRDRCEFADREDLRIKAQSHLREILGRPTEELKAATSRLWKVQSGPGDVFEGRDENLAALNRAWADVLARNADRPRIISLVAVGGAGKSTLLTHWKNELLRRDESGGVERYFDWSFYAQGAGTDADRARMQVAADSTAFVAEALKFFGDLGPVEHGETSWDRGARLAVLVAKHRTLLLLDGLEPLQYAPGPRSGRLKDDALLALFSGLQQTAQGLCVVTSRERIADLASTKHSSTPCWPLQKLTSEAGARVLKRKGVVGPEPELQKACTEAHGHALTISLMGQYLRLAFSPPDIARRDCFGFAEADATTQDGHAFRVFAAYERWLAEDGRTVEVAILRLLGLFDRPATPDCLTALAAAPAIAGLTEPLIGLPEAGWNIALERLEKLGLISFAAWHRTVPRGYARDVAMRVMAAGERTPSIGQSEQFTPTPMALVTARSIDAHPLLREYFARQLDSSGSGPTAHARLCEHLCGAVPYWPDGREGLLPLFQAVHHACKAGRIFFAKDEILQKRILRGIQGPHKDYAFAHLGLHDLTLAAFARFFRSPWRDLSDELDSQGRGWVLATAAFILRALNRLTEARDAMNAGLEIDRNIGGLNWWDARNAAIAASNLSELELLLGNVQDAVETGKEAVDWADRSGCPRHQATKRIAHAVALHCAGRRGQSRAILAQALLAARRPGGGMSVGWALYLRTDCLLDEAESQCWQRLRQPLPNAASRDSTLEQSVSDRAVMGHIRGAPNLDSIERVTKNALQSKTRSTDYLSIALSELTLGRVHLIRSILGTTDPHLQHAKTWLDSALAGLRKEGQLQFLPLALLPCAWHAAVAGEITRCRDRLDEAYALATRGGIAESHWRGGMRLFIVETLLYRVRLFGLGCSYPWPGSTPEQDLASAAALAVDCGYHRRDVEFRELRMAIPPTGSSSLPSG